MLIAYSKRLGYRVGFILSLSESGFTTSVYRQWVEGTHSEESKIDGASIADILAGRDLVISPPVTFDFAEIQGRREFSDYGFWCSTLDPLDIQKPLGIWFNRFAETAITRRDREESPRNMETAPLHVYVPFLSSTFAECALHIMTHPDWPLIIDHSPVEQEVEATRSAVLPRIEATNALQVAADGYASVPVRLVDQQGELLSSAACDLYLAETGGYLPKRRVRAVDGKAWFKVGALGLDPGDTVKIKLGFRHFSGLADINVEVV
ncbi:hypothetical protein [Magnetospirillum sp. SS-4]|uniref:hypothetical protein n=1 Tax=Magnetospirillum sp. SS-4 TaxID=2681465 RepID=UPI00137F069E|nr:hypothetical protein [Magnetospirillum sp. SS-4]CAA7620611.1 conserved hypothetical protein [Magnetospirillum sp. SS-4]